MNRACRLFVFLPLGVVLLLASVFSFLSYKGELYAADPSKKIRIGGTGTDLATMRLLADEFRKRNPDITVTVLPSLGSSGGIKALIGGDLDIVISYRGLSVDEQAKGLTAVEYSKTPFVFLTHKTNRLSNITLPEVVDIYNGKTKVWPDNTPVRLILRPAGEANTKILGLMSEEMKKAVQASFERSGLNIAVNDQENMDLMEKLPGSFGAGALSQIISERRNVNVLSLNGVKPNVKTLADGTYPYYKPLYLITVVGASPHVRQFINFVFSPAGRSVLSKTGHLVIR